MYRTRTRSYFHHQEFSWKQISINTWCPVPLERENACVRIIVSFLEAFSWSFTSPRYNTMGPSLADWTRIYSSNLEFQEIAWVKFQCWWLIQCECVTIMMRLTKNNVINTLALSTIPLTSPQTYSCLIANQHCSPTENLSPIPRHNSKCLDLQHWWYIHCRPPFHCTLFPLVTYLTRISLLNRRKAPN